MATYGHLNASLVKRSAPKCCGFSARFIHYFLFIFNYIFFISGVLILLLTLLYGRDVIDLGETHLSVIRSLIAGTHLVNLIHYAMVACGLAICLIALINAMVACCDSSLDAFDEPFDDETQLGLTSPSQSLASRRERSAEGRTDRRTERRTERRKRSNGEHRDHRYDHKPKRANRSSIALCLFIFSLLLLFTFQLIIGMVSFISLSPNSEGKDEFVSSLSDNLNVTQLLVDYDSSLSPLYQHFKCCGWHLYDDYQASNTSSAVSDFCCKTVTEKCGLRKHPSNIYYDGCVDKFGPILKEYVLILGSVALGFSIVEVFGLIFSCCLYVQTISIN